MIDIDLNFKFYWWIFALWHHSAIIVVPIYILIMSKIKVLHIEARLGTHIFNMWAIYFISLYLNDHYLTPKLNKIFIGFEGGIMGWEGNVEDFFLQLVILIPLYILVMRVSTVKFKSKSWMVLYFLFYYVINYTFLTAYTYIFKWFYNY